VIGCKDLVNYVTKGDLSSTMVLEEAEMPKYVTNAHKEREVVVATTPSTRDRMKINDDFKDSTRDQTKVNDDFKDYLPSEA
jgi:hypothetical protein